jgi:3-isopropylmalate dehydratase small subunit
MKPFHTLTSVAAPMPDADIDTDVIFPARYLLLTTKTGLGPYAFFDRRFTPEGGERPEFVLNRAPWRQAGILVAGANFGCGSSREQAPWALADLGLRCIVAPGFGEIFRANCYANGMLPIVLGPQQHGRVMREAEAARTMTVDLMGCAIELTGDAAGDPIPFEVPQRQRDALLAGLDEIGLIQRHEGDRIAEFEQRQRERMPWLFAPH